MRKESLGLAGAVLVLIAAEGRAQTTLEQLRAQASQQLGRLEVSLTLLDTIDQQGVQLESRNDNIIARRDEANRDQEQNNSYCQGTFDEPEYSRRVAQCSTWQAGIDARQNDIDNEFAALQRQHEDLRQRRETTVQEGQQLLEGFTEATRQWIGACLEFPVNSRPAACGPLASAGPFTSELLDVAEEAFAILERECGDEVVLERIVECQRQAWDGSDYRPGRQVLPDPPR